MQGAVYTSNSATSISDLLPFPQAMVILIMAWLLTWLLISLWDRNREQSRGPWLPVVWLTLMLTAALCVACTGRGNLPGGSYGTWRTGPDGEQASVTIWRSGEAWLRIGEDRLQLRK